MGSAALPLSACLTAPRSSQLTHPAVGYYVALAGSTLTLLGAVVLWRRYAFPCDLVAG
jgi:hypothetical protein